MDLAALDIKIGADLSKLQKDLNSAGVLVDQFSKDIAAVGANSAAASGGMQAIATSAAKVAVAFKEVEATNFPAVIDETSDKAKILQRQFSAFAGLSPFKNAGADLSKFSIASKPIADQLTKTAKASGTATLAVGNFGRVLQDLPFGFIGITNNLNPLLEGFQRLAKESKATGVSIGSSLLKSLTGAGGLGLALSVVSAALTFASFGLSAWTRGFGDNKKAVDEAKEALDGYLKNAASEITSLRVLEKVATDTSNAYSVRKKAVDELQKSYPAYLGNLTDEAILNGQAADAINEVAAALAKKAFLQASESTLTDFATKQLQARKEELDLISKQRQAQLELTKAQADFARVGGTSLGQGAQGYLNIIGKAQAKIQDTGKDLEKNRKTQQDLNNDFTYFLNIAEQLKAETIQLDPDPNGKVKQTRKDIQTISDVLAKLQLELSAVTARELNEGLNLSSEKINNIRDVINKLIVEFKVPPDDTIINKLFGDIKDIKFSAVNFREFINNLEKSIPVEQAPEIPVKINPVFDRAGFEDIVNRARIEFEANKFNIELPVNFEFANANELNEIVSRINAASDSLQSLNDTIMATLASGLQDFFTSIGDSLAGQENPFKAFANIMSDGFKAIGQALIAYGIQVGIIQKVLANPFNPVSPILAIAAGIALQAAGAILESSLKNITGMAEGGIVPPGHPNDTFLARLSSNEAVIPLDKGLGKFLDLSHEPIVIIPDARISGNDIVISYERTQRKNKRTF